MRWGAVLVPLIALFEIVFMLSPASLPFYATYGPALTWLQQFPETAWLTKFYLPHIAQSANPLIAALPRVGFIVLLSGFAVFLWGALLVYRSKWTGHEAVVSGLYRWFRHPQYASLTIAGAGAALVWPRFLVLVAFAIMVLLYNLLARHEERRCMARFGDAYRDYLERTRRWWHFRLNPVATLAVFSLLAPALVWGATQVRDWSLEQLTVIDMNGSVIVSLSQLPEQELSAVVDLALRDSQVSDYTRRVDSNELIVHVAPGSWSLADLPLDAERMHDSGHHTPREHDRENWRILVSRGLPATKGLSGTKRLAEVHALEPLIVIELRAGKVSSIRSAPPQASWGPAPMPVF